MEFMTFNIKKGEHDMKNTRHTSVVLLALVLAASSFSLVTVSPAYACGGYPCPPPEPEPTKGNNGFGQEKHGAPQDGENPGSDQGKGIPSGGPGAGWAGFDSKQDGTGLR